MHIASWLLIALSTSPTTLYAPSAHVRPLDRLCAAAMARGAAVSATFRTLVQRIQGSDVIVYVECGQRLRSAVAGVTRLSGYGGTYRYVRVSIDWRIAGDQAVAILGHELHHVTEIAGAPHVIDAAGMRELYMTLGDRSCPLEPACFDTMEAQRAGARVWSELRASARP